MKRTDSKAATREYERRRWAIGDAIAQDIAESSDFDFRECSRALMARGYDYDERRGSTGRRRNSPPPIDLRAYRGRYTRRRVIPKP
jgi:hypothetical protein